MIGCRRARRASACGSGEMIDGIGAVKQIDGELDGLVRNFGPAWQTEDRFVTYGDS